MQVESAMGAVQAARRLAASGDELCALAADAASLVGPGRTHLDATITAAIDHGGAAVDLLTTAGLPSSRVSDVERAVAMLGARPTGTSMLRAQAIDLSATARRAIGAIDTHATDDVRPALLDELLARDPVQLDSSDWIRVRDLLARDPSGTLHAAPRTLPDEPPLQQLVAAVISDPQAAANPSLDRYLRAARLARTGPDELRSRALTLADRPIGELGVDDWRDLGALLDADMDGSVLTAGMDARTRSNLQARIRARADVVDGASAEALEPDAEIRKLLGVIEISAAPPERVKAGAAKLFARDPESLSAEEWTRLQTMLESDPAGAVLTGPRDLRGVDPMLTWIPDLASGRSSKVNNGLDRYFEAWRLQDATPEQLRDAAAELLARPSDALARRDWSRLAATFDVDEAGILPSVGTAGHDGEPAGKWLARLATGDRHHEHGELAEWFTAMRTALDPEHPKQVDAAVEALAAGAGSPGDAALLAGESQRVAALTAERTPVEQLRIADELLALDVVASTRGSRETLELVRDSLRRIEGVPDALDQPLRDARSMAKLNLQRLDQEIPNPGAPGAPRYPDYSEIGRIRSTVKLLRSIIDPRPAVSSTAAPTVTGAATEAAEAASGTLLW